MKKALVLILAAVLLCSSVTALAQAYPGKSSFATMSVKTKGYEVTVTLSKPVDRLFANWPNDLCLIELAVSEDLQASVFTYGHSCALGTVFDENAPLVYYLCSDTFGLEFATPVDRAFVTLQGDWIVSYNRKGDIVDIAPAKTKDINAIREVAFKQF